MDIYIYIFIYIFDLPQTLIATYIVVACADCINSGQHKLHLVVTYVTICTHGNNMLLWNKSMNVIPQGVLRKKELDVQDEIAVKEETVDVVAPVAIAPVMPLVKRRRPWIPVVQDPYM